MSLFFGIIVWCRNFCYDKFSKLVIRSKFPVISVGNLSVGGTGKTPFVIELSNIISELGHHPCIIGRNINSNPSKNNYTIVSDGENILSDTKQAGDEMQLIAQKTNLPVLSGKSKSFLALILEKIISDNSDIFTKQIDTIIIDDGFQHRKLYRNLDIVLIDKQTITNPNLLPKGRLRENFSSLKRADIIVLSKGAMEKDLLKKYPTDKPIITFKTELGEFYTLNKSTKNNSKNNNYDFFVVTGIANPKNFIEMLNEKKINIVGEKIFSDHHIWTEKEINLICKKCDELNCNIATTEKDAVKLSTFINTFEAYNINVNVFPLINTIITGREKLKSAISNLYISLH